MSSPLVSILLLTRDGAATLEAVLDAIAAQDAGFAHETVAVDSGSTDATLSLLEDRVDRLVRIAPARFDHGLTRNLAAESARGQLLVFLVQDAVPIGTSWLKELVSPLLADPTVAASFARQVPRDDASALTRTSVLAWHAAGSTPSVRRLAGAATLQAMSPEERLRSCVLDNVCSCLRRSAWEELPFRPTPIAEDLEWGRDALLAGWGIAFAPAAAVVHSHERSPRYEFWRTYLLHRRLHQLFGLRTVPSLAALAHAVLATVPAHVKALAGPRPARGPSLLAEASRALALALVWPLGQYLGGRAAAHGLAERRPDGV